MDDAKCPDVMTPAHPLWEDFMNRVAEAMAGPSVQDILDIVRQGCNGPGGSAVFASSRAVLARMELELDIAASLAFFKAHGAACDCEGISMNIGGEDAQTRWRHSPDLPRPVPRPTQAVDRLGLTLWDAVEKVTFLRRSARSMVEGGSGRPSYSGVASTRPANGSSTWCALRCRCWGVRTCSGCGR